MARKTKKRNGEMPPLSFVDKLIYCVIFLILCMVYFGGIWGSMLLRDKIAFSDPTVMAAHERGSLLWLSVPLMTVLLMTFIPWIQLYQARRPIFGRKDIRYGPPQWAKVYPLFMKNKPAVWVSEREKKSRRRTAALLLVLLMVGFIPFPWTLYGRNCLRRDGSCVQYNSFDRLEKEFASEEISAVEIRTGRYSSGRYTTRWGVQMRLTTDSGEEFLFEHHDFRGDTQDGTLCWLNGMLEAKACYDPQIIRFDGVEKLERVIADQQLDQEQIELLYQLFGQ